MSDQALTNLLLVFIVMIGLAFLLWARVVMPTFRRHGAPLPGPTNPIEGWRQLQTFRRLCREHSHPMGTYWALVILTLLINVLGLWLLVFRWRAMST